MADLFDAAAEFVQVRTTATGDTPLPDHVLLSLYGYYKQATEGSCTLKKPGLLDFRGRVKYDAWKRLGDMSQEEAQAGYVALVTQHFGSDWQNKEMGTTNVSGPVFSTLGNITGDDETQASDYPRIIGATQAGNSKDIVSILQDTPLAVADRDSEGCTALHWAADKGYRDIASLLIDAGADVQAKDVDGLTPLDYAVMSEHNDDVFSRLLSCNTSVS